MITAFSILFERSFFLGFFVIDIILLLLWNYLRKRRPKGYAEPLDELAPLPLDFSPIDYLKAFISWLFLFMRVFWLAPGYYFAGEKNKNAPLLATSNNFLTVFLLARRLGARPARMLVIDTGGINVWCAAGKGTFSSEEIVKQAERHNLLPKKEGKPENKKIILPKFGLSGVKLDELKKAGFFPIIGPLYAKDIPAYLDEGKFRNRDSDKVNFGLKSRGFTALPTAMQFFVYFLTVYVLSFGYLPFRLVTIAVSIAFFYPILFPWLPGRRFSIKGLWIGAFAAVLAYFVYGEGMATILFTIATSIFVALSYTGNSAVSAYTKVRKETAIFLPITVLLYIAFLATLFWKAV